ncbi:MAG: bifunctional phosphopantothenoylcysteine decarboxylase/phosphopantothenate--cysteine ligase CoaBC [Acidimicrobiia bacterium]|nr:bifunctional phosphopantothenoylcysteine decarboxylase/phosphopantothenate--cysteine ligase CoaBC [Acidimicrobiia bacterium]
MLEGKRIVLGVTGGIAAYKAVDVCRRLVDLGAHVAPVLTRGAERFIGVATFDALASERTQRSLWDEESPIPHTRLGQGADVVVVCPATARLLSDYRTGRSGDLLTATLMATRAPVVLAPAMHTEMWEQPAIQENVQVLRNRGVVMVDPEPGRLAGGDIGFGRLARTESIVDATVAAAHGRIGDLAGLHVLVTAGGTREPLDPVRFLGNRSTGKQGVALAREALARGARVTLITTSDLTVSPTLRTVRVETADEMHEAVHAHVGDADIVVMAAAVADFRPAREAGQKLKKHDGPPRLELEATTDILAELGASKPPGQVLVGFAAETADLRANATAKLAKKGADLIIGNDVSAPEVGFGHDTNAVIVVGADGFDKEIPLSDKREIARAVLDSALDVRTRTGRDLPKFLETQRATTARGDGPGTVTRGEQL